MNYQPQKTAGEVTVTSYDVMSNFEQRSIQILRHANELFEKDDFSDLPSNIKELFSNKFSRYLLSDYISLFATYYLRPIVRHHPTCKCVGADENVFAHILRLSSEGEENEVKILGSLLIKSNQLENLSKKAKVVAFLINEDLSGALNDPRKSQTAYKHQLH